MSVIPITLFFSLLLAGSFVGLFAREQRRRRFASAERDSLLPLADETPRLAARAEAPAHGRENCGGRDGARRPCPGCLHRTEAAPASTPLLR
jgi:hypothetical protein